MVLAGQQLETGMIQYASRDGTMIDALYSRPAEPGNYPAVIVTMEGMGLMNHHKDIAVRFAGRGFLAIAPDLYTREGTPEPENVLATLFASPDSRAMDDLDGAALFLKSQAHSNGKVGIIGFCSGGRYTLMMACQSSNIDAAVDSAGGHIADQEITDLRPVNPIDMIPNLSCPLLALFGIEDPEPDAGAGGAPQGGAGQARQDLRMGDVRQRGPRLLRRLPPQLPRRPGPGYVAQGARVLRQAPVGLRAVAGIAGVDCQGRGARLCAPVSAADSLPVVSGAPSQLAVEHRRVRWLCGRGILPRRVCHGKSGRAAWSGRPDTERNLVAGRLRAKSRRALLFRFRLSFPTSRCPIDSRALTTAPHTISAASLLKPPFWSVAEVCKYLTASSMCLAARAIARPPAY